jgi:hypothetical protein
MADDDGVVGVVLSEDVTDTFPYTCLKLFKASFASWRATIRRVNFPCFYEGGMKIDEVFIFMTCNFSEIKLFEVILILDFKIKIFCDEFCGVSCSFKGRTIDGFEIFSA